MNSLDPTPPRNTDDPEVSLRDLWRIFGTIGITSFGGGLSGWMYRELVERRHWITPEEFLAGLALARTMPGPNVVNLAVWIGYRLRKTRGAFIATFSVLIGPFVLILLCAAAYERVSHSSTLHQILLGVSAAAIGLSLQVSFKSLFAAAKKPFYAIIALVTFVGVGVLHQPMLPITLGLAAISVAWSFLVEEPNEG